MSLARSSPCRPKWHCCATEFRQLREEVEIWKAESHKHFCDAQYWRAMHQKALERIAQRDQEIDRLKGQVRDLRQQLFGRKSKGKAETGFAGPREDSQRSATWPATRRCRAWAAGPLPLPAVVIAPVDLPAEERCCPRCHLPYAEFPGTEDSSTIEIDVRAHRRVIQRKRYRRTCSCPDSAGDHHGPRATAVICQGDCRHFHLDDGLAGQVSLLSADTPFAGRSADLRGGPAGGHAH